MDLGSLELLVTIIEAGNLSAAARRLQMSRANVSHRLAQFERQLGQQVLRRTTRRMEPTEIGLRLYAHGCTIRDELAAARDSVASLGKTLQGRVRLSVPTGYGQLVLAEWLIAFKQQHPDVLLEVVFENRVENLLSNEVDLAIRVMAEPPDNLVARPISQVRFMACAAAHWAQSHPALTHWQDLQHAPLITSTVGRRQMHLTARCGNHSEEVLIEPKLVSENFQFLKQAVLAGLGVGIVPRYVVESELREGRVVLVLPQWELSIAQAQAYLLYMPGRHKTRSMTALIEFLCARAAQVPQALQPV